MERLCVSRLYSNVARKTENTLRSILKFLHIYGILTFHEVTYIRKDKGTDKSWEIPVVF